MKREVVLDQEERERLIPVPEADNSGALTCDFESDSPTKLRDYIKAFSHKGLWGTLSSAYYITCATVTVVIINTRNQMDLVLWQTISNVTNSSMTQNATTILVENTTLESILGVPGFWVLIGTTVAASAFLTVGSRLAPLGTLTNGVSIALKKLGHKISSDEKKFLSLADAKLEINTAVFNRKTDQIYVKVPRQLVERDGSHFNFLEKVLKGEHGSGIIFTYTPDVIKRSEDKDTLRVLHLAYSHEKKLNLPIPDCNVYTDRYHIDGFFETPWSLWDIVYIPAKFTRFVLVRCAADLLMGFGSFVSLMKVFGANRPDISTGVRLLILGTSLVFVIGRVRTNDAFKVRVAYFFTDASILRIGYWRWPTFREAFFPALAAGAVSGISILYGYGFGEDFGVRGITVLGEQLGWLIPSAQNVQLPGFLLTLGAGYYLLQGPASALFYGMTAFPSLFKKFAAWFSCGNCEQKKTNTVEERFTKAQKILITGIVITGIIDAMVYFGTTYLFLENAGMTERLTNLFWYIAESMGPRYSILAIIVAFLNAFQNLTFILHSAIPGGVKQLSLCFKDLRISNYQPHRAEQLLDGGSSSSDGEGSTKLSLLFAEPGKPTPEAESKHPAYACSERCTIL